jgi:hypothetical protein
MHSKVAEAAGMKPESARSFETESRAGERAEEFQGKHNREVRSRTALCQREWTQDGPRLIQIDRRDQKEGSDALGDAGTVVMEC